MTVYLKISILFATFSKSCAKRLEPLFQKDIGLYLFERYKKN